jgi:uncharacterized protein YyaL (SSP411 family)
MYEHMFTEYKFTNKLINEKSPYLQQHAHNPVNWYPWGDEAFSKAKSEDKPVFLSIGYSSCHWCHVMEHESFEDDEVADILNKNFISIKVDREERPDVDNLYMSACMAMNGGGGWPLSCFLTQEKQVFFAGTYYPKKDSYGVPGFINVLEYIADIWHTKRVDLQETSSLVMSRIKEKKSLNQLEKSTLDNAYQQLLASFDKRYGGFGAAPKFPSLQNILFLLRYGKLNPQSNANEMVSKTLNAMAQGGIFDHIGGGFCRYSTDERWLVPHFEKMMYDNAMHIMAYSEASVAIDKQFETIVAQIIEFCKSEMLHANGGFFTAIDADSEGREGTVYLWTPMQIAEILGEEQAEVYCKLYNITDEGNFEGKNILNHIGTQLNEREKLFANECNKKLLEARNKRVPPFKDKKILTSSNGLMIAALALAGKHLKNIEYLNLSANCADFVLTELVKDERLLARWIDGHADHLASSDDYAYLIWGLIELYEADFNPQWLEYAVEWQKRMMNLFWDEDGGFYLSGNDVTDLPFKQKNTHDGAIASGNSVSVSNLIRIARLTGEAEYEKMAFKLVQAVAGSINNYPAAFAGLLCGVLYFKNGEELVLCIGRGIEEFKNALPSYLPFTVTTICGNGFEKMLKLAPSLRSMQSIDNKATVYLCKNGACNKPVTEIEELKKAFISP